MEKEEPSPEKENPKQDSKMVRFLKKPVFLLLILLFAVAKPLMSTLCINLGLQCVSALCEPIVESKYIKMLSGISKNLTFLSVLILAVAFMFSILTFIVISCANGV